MKFEIKVQHHLLLKLVKQNRKQNPDVDRAGSQPVQSHFPLKTNFPQPNTTPQLASATLADSRNDVLADSVFSQSSRCGRCFSSGTVINVGLLKRSQHCKDQYLHIQYHTIILYCIDLTMVGQLPLDNYSSTWSHLILSPASIHPALLLQY